MKKKGFNEWSANYISLTGFRQRNVNTGGDPNVLDIEIKTISGSIDLEVKSAEGTVIYSSKAIPTSSFKVEVAEAVSVRVNSKSHRGGYSVKWS